MADMLVMFGRGDMIHLDVEVELDQVTKQKHAASRHAFKGGTSTTLDVHARTDSTARRHDLYDSLTTIAHKAEQTQQSSFDLHPHIPLPEALESCCFTTWPPERSRSLTH